MRVYTYQAYFFYHDINMSTGKFNILCSCFLHISIIEEREMFKTTSLRFFDFHISFLLVGKKRVCVKSNLISDFQKDTFPRDLEKLKKRRWKNELFRGEKINKSGRRIKIPRNNNRGRSFSKVPRIDDLQRHDSAIRKR